MEAILLQRLAIVDVSHHLLLDQVARNWSEKCCRQIATVEIRRTMFSIDKKLDVRRDLRFYDVIEMAFLSVIW